MLNQIKGLAYEKQVRDHILQTKQCYLWPECPENILLQYGLINSHNQNRIRRKENKANPLADTGVDIIQINDNNTISFVQCKNGYNNGLGIENLAGYFYWLLTFPSINGYIYYTSKLSNNLTMQVIPRNQFIKMQFETDVDYEQQKQLTYHKEIISITPYNYQIEAKKAINEYFIDDDRCILNLPCGVGKTYTSYLVSEKFKQIIIISPLRQFAKQNLDRYIEYGYKHKTLLIDSDNTGTRDETKIMNFIISNNNFLISTTYQSVDLINKYLFLFDNPLIIVDECHNLSKNNITNELDDFYSILNNSHIIDNTNSEQEIGYELNSVTLFDKLKYKMLFMSATPRIYEMEDDDTFDTEAILGPIVYKMNFNEAIENNYICDYTVWLPSITENHDELLNELSIYDIDETIKAKMMFLYSCLINNGSMKTIVYCRDKEEIRLMREALIKLDDYYILDCISEQITSDNTEKERSLTLTNFSNSDKRFLLFSVRILDECIDIPKCDSIYITYPTQSKIRTIQRLCRCLRIDKSNKYKKGNIFIWCDDYAQILDTLSGIKEYDIKFADKIKVNSENHYGKSSLDKELNADIQKVSSYIIGIKEFKTMKWTDKLDQIKAYINENNKRPSKFDKNNETKQMSRWLSTQLKNYKKKIQIMSNKTIYDTFTQFLSEYEAYFKLNDEIWKNNLNQVIKYIDTNNKRPSSSDINNEIKHLGIWLNRQSMNYTNKVFIMSNENIYDQFTNFLSKYKEYFESNNDIWKNNLIQVKEYINTNNKRPSTHDKNNETKQLGKWLSKQIVNYKKKSKNMSNEIIYNEFTIFLSKYKKYFESNNDIWEKNLIKVKTYIDKNNKKPSNTDKNYDIKQLGHWLSLQITNYKKKCKIMSEETIYNEFTNFLADYEKYFKSNDDIWNKHFDNVKSYININNKRPSSEDKNNETKQLGQWLLTQLKNYKKKSQIMSDDTIYSQFSNFLQEYELYFKTNNEVWNENLNQLKAYIDKNKKKPSKHDKNQNIKKCGQWLCHQLIKHKKKSEIMLDETIYNTFTEFLSEYKAYFNITQLSENNTTEDSDNITNEDSDFDINKIAIVAKSKNSKKINHQPNKNNI